MMIELIKKGVLAGIGATVVTKDALESALDDLVKKGKISATDAKETAEKITDKGRSQFESARGELNTFFNDLLQKANLVTQDQLKALEEKVTALEKQLKAAENNAEEPAEK